jgi:TPR repeat protein
MKLVLKTAGVIGALLYVMMVMAPAWASDFMEEARADYQARKFEDARAVFQAQAGDGNAEALYYLGLMSWYGFGCHQDYEQAKSWLSQASDGDFKPAKWGLAMFQQYGLDIDLSPEEALAESQRLMTECGYAGQAGVVKNEYANRFVNDSMVLVQAMVQEMNEGNQVLDRDRDAGISHLHKAEEFLAVAKKSGPLFSQPCQFILFNLHNTYRSNNIEPLYPELYERNQRTMKTGVARAEDQRQQLVDKLKKRYGIQ